MYRLRLPFSLGLVSLACSMCLTGCSMGSFPNASANPEQTPLGAMSGSNWGGHAPLAGAHIYVVEPGNTGYGSPVKSLLTAGSGTVQNGNWTNANFSQSDQFIPSTAYGILAGADSTYNITGDYTCDVGRPVWVIGYGGDPTFPANNPTFTENNAVINGSTGLETITLPAGVVENFYVGEAIQISGYPVLGIEFNQSGTVIAGSGSTALTTSSFTIQTTNTNGLNVNLNDVTDTGTVTASPVFNPAAVNVASLGICPSTGTLASSIRYIYMNEISTAAWAYAYNQFANWSVNDQSGNNEFNVGAPASNQQALVNAAYVAANLYDIQGGNTSTTYAGEGHIARSQTPSGAGIVPQTTLDTLGDILASCVDSPNTYRLQQGVVSTQCNTLESHATDNGVYDSTTTILTATETHIAFNIAQAALNIAHYPQGNGTGTTSNGVQTITSPGTSSTASAFVSALFNIPTGNVPFAPYLTAAPNDFMVGINWQSSPYAKSGTQPSSGIGNSTTNTGSTTNAASVGEVAIDATGNAWIVNNVYNSTSTLKLSPAGYYTTYGTTYYDSFGTTSIAGLAIDTSNNVFVSSTAGVMELSPSNNYGFQSAGAVGYTTGFPVTQNSAEVAVDNSGYLYVADLEQANPPSSSSGSMTSQLVKMAATPGTTSSTFTIAGTGAATQNTATSCANYMGYVTLDASGNIWTSNQNNVYSPGSTICRFSNTGTLQYSYVLTPTIQTSGFAHQIAVDLAGNAWFADKNNNNLQEVLAGATNTAPTNGTASTYTASGVLSAPKGVAVDGKNTIWVTNTGNASISQFSDTGTLMSPTYYVGSGGFNAVQNCSSSCTPSALYALIDQSGNLWSSDIGHGEVIEFIGVAAPTVQPLAQQRYGTANSSGHGVGQLP